jgi:hypothetical protein
MVAPLIFEELVASSKDDVSITGELQMRIKKEETVYFNAIL